MKKTLVISTLLLLTAGCSKTDPEGSRGPAECVDNFDNDQDGLIDCADPDCCELEACSAAPECSTTTTMTNETGYVYQGYSMSDFFPFDGMRTWEYVNTDVAVPYKLIATLDTEHKAGDGPRAAGNVFTVDYSYECLDPKGKDCPDAGFVRAVRWQSNSSSGVLLHSFEDSSGRTNYDPPITLAAGRMKIGDSVNTQTGSVNYTATFDTIVSACPIRWVDTWTDCPKITLDDDGAGAPLAGVYYAIGGYNVVAMELTGDTGQWQLIYATYAEI